MHAFRSGTAAAAAALANFSASKKGERMGRLVGFPRPKTRRRSTPSVSFVEINHQLSWLAPDRHGVRLMLPQSSPNPDVRRRCSQLEWIHTTESTRRLYRLVESGRATIQKVTISHRGGRWQVAFSVRHLVRPPVPPRRQSAAGRVVGIDAGLVHLATLSTPVPGLSDEDGHVANPAVLAAHLRRLKKLDRAVSPCRGGVEEPEAATPAPGPLARTDCQDEGLRATPRLQRTGAPLRHHRDRGPQRGWHGCAQGSPGAFRRRCGARGAPAPAHLQMCRSRCHLDRHRSFLPFVEDLLVVRLGESQAGPRDQGLRLPRLRARHGP